MFEHLLAGHDTLFGCFLLLARCHTSIRQGRFLTRLLFWVLVVQVRLSVAGLAFARGWLGLAVLGLGRLLAARLLGSLDLLSLFFLLPLGSYPSFSYKS